MKSALRSISAILLAATLLLSSIASGMAQGHNPAAGTAVLCLNEVAVEVAVDLQGRPTNAGQHCPDCFITVLDGLIPATAPVVDSIVRQTILSLNQMAQWSGARLLPPRGRSPPVLSDSLYS
ncbi:MAG: hypothetical protein ABJO67_00650 [Pseudoruegeria sp.]